MESQRHEGHPREVNGKPRDVTLSHKGSATVSQDLSSLLPKHLCFQQERLLLHAVHVACHARYSLWRPQLYVEATDGGTSRNHYRQEKWILQACLLVGGP